MADGMTSSPYVWLQTQDSKATAFSRLLFAMRPWYVREPAQVDGLRLATVADPVAVAAPGVWRSCSTPPTAAVRTRPPPLHGSASCTNPGPVLGRRIEEGASAGPQPGYSRVGPRGPRRSARGRPVPGRSWRSGNGPRRRTTVTA